MREDNTHFFFTDSLFRLASNIPNRPNHHFLFSIIFTNRLGLRPKKSPIRFDSLSQMLDKERKNERNVRSRPLPLPFDESILTAIIHWNRKRYKPGHPTDPPVSLLLLLDLRSFIDCFTRWNIFPQFKHHHRSFSIDVDVAPLE